MNPLQCIEKRVVRQLAVHGLRVSEGGVRSSDRSRTVTQGHLCGLCVSRPVSSRPGTKSRDPIPLLPSFFLDRSGKTNILLLSIVLNFLFNRKSQAPLAEELR